MALPRLPLLISTICLVSPTAYGEEITLPTVNVTAKGYASSNIETPLSTIVLDREEIIRRGGQNLGDTLRGEPGIAIANDSAQGQNPIIRGQGRESIVLLVDGMRLNSAQPAGAIASFMSLSLAEQVEVVRGSGSVLYGTGAIGGVINVRLPQARFTPGISTDFITSFDSASQGVRGTGIVNASVEDHAFMVGASLARIDDYHSPEGRVKRTGYDSDSFIGQYRYRISPQQQLRLSLQQHQDKDIWYPGSTKKHMNPMVGSTTIHSPDQERRLAEIGYNQKNLADLPINFDIRLYRQDMERSIYSRANGLGRDIVTNKVTFETTGLDIKTDWLAHPNHLLSFGINAWEMTGDPDRHMATAPPFTTLVVNNPFQDAKIEAIGAYLQDDMNFGNLNILAGLRYDTVKADAKSMNSNSPNKVTTGLDHTDSAVSGSLGAIYQVAPLLRPYASYTLGFRAPGMRERYESGVRGDGYYYVGSPDVDAETSRQIEIGLKGESEKFNYTLSIYHNKIDDYLTGSILTGQTAIALCGAANAANCKKNVNLGSVTLKGIEFQGRWQVAYQHWLSLNYSRVRGENDDLDEPLQQMPADEISLGWIGPLMHNWTADATLRLVDRQNRIARQFTAGRENKTPGFVTADIGASWQIDKRNMLRLAVRNLADQTYHEHLTEGESGDEIKAPGRSLQIVWKGSF